MDRRFLVVIVVLLIVTAGWVGVDSFFEPNTKSSGRDLQFNETAESKGIEYMATSSMPVTRGGAVYVADFNNDEWPDLFMIGGTARRSESGAYLGSHPALFENVGGEFERAKSKFPAKKLDDGNWIGAVFFDYDNDGWTDLLLMPEHGDPTFLANKNGTFKVREVGLDLTLHEPIGATVADYNKDGYLDLFIYQNGNWKNTTPMGYRKPNSSVKNDNGNQNLLFRGNGSGFVRVTDAGIKGDRWSLAASFVDVTGDGYPDIHVANDYNNDYLYINQRDGTFRQVELGESTNRNGMSSEVFDVNRDGRLDIFVTNIYFNVSNIGNSQLGTTYLEHTLGKRLAGNTLLLNRGNGKFVDIAAEYGVQKGGWGWAAAAVDFDNDMDTDLIHATKEFSPGFSEGNAPYIRYPTIYEYVGGQFTIRNSTQLGFESSNGLGLVHLDFDRDGDQDIVISTFNGKFLLYENTVDTGNWLQVRVSGKTAKNAIGARVYIQIDNTSWMQVVNAKSDFESQDTRVLHFGLGSHKSIKQMRIVWPDGTERVFKNISANQRIIISPDGIEKAPRNVDK